MIDTSECAEEDLRAGGELHTTLNQLISSNTGSLLKKPMTRKGKHFGMATGLPLGLGSSMIGNWIYDTLSSHSTQKTLKQMQDRINEIIVEVNKVNYDSVIHHENLKTLWSYTVKNRQDIQAIKKTVSCLTDQLFLTRFFTILLSYVPNQFHRALSDILAGHVTLDKLGHNQLLYMLTHHVELRKSIIMENPHFLYQCAESIPIHIGMDSTATIIYILRIPLITQENIGDLYKVTNFGSMDKSGHYRLVLPNYVALLPGAKTSNVSAVSPIGCKMMGGLWSCPSHSLEDVKGLTCIQALYHRNTSSGCDVERKSPLYDPMIQDTGTGVFIATLKYPITLYNKTGNSRTTRLIPANPLSLPHWISYSSFDGLVVGLFQVDGDHTLSAPPTTSNIPVYHFKHINNTDSNIEEWKPVNLSPHSPSPPMDLVNWTPQSIYVPVIVPILTSLLSTGGFLLWLSKRAIGNV